MDIKKLRLRAMYNPRSLTKAEWDMLYEDAFSVPKSKSDEDIIHTTIGKQRKKWW